MGMKADSALEGAKTGSVFGPIGTTIGAGLGFMEGGKNATGEQVGNMADIYRQSIQQLNNSRNDALRIDDNDKKAIMDSFDGGWGIY